MRNINNYITESVKCTNDEFNLHIGIQQKPQYEYVIIFPIGGVEMYSKKALMDMISNEDDWDDEDLLDTYTELSELPADDEWHMISGPLGHGDLKNTLGQHCKI